MDERTAVVFRAYGDGEVVALFPELPADPTGNLCSCYIHVGQHGAADYAYTVRQTRPATPEEYAPLAAELQAAPYRYALRVIHRAGPSMHAKRRADAARD